MVPEYDWDLHRRLEAMRERDGCHRRFYQSAAWRKLRAKVLEEFHGESWDEAHASPARYVPATCVHHEMHVDRWPGWALSEFWADASGEVHRNLFPLSHDAHDARHGRCGFAPKAGGLEGAPAPLTEEWW